MTTVEIKLKGLDNVLQLLQQLPPEVVSKRGGPVRAALRKGARLVQKAELANLQRVLANSTDPDRRISTGLLLQNVVVTRGKAPTDGNGERYLVRVRRKTYPGRNGEAVTTLKSAQLLEYGSAKQPPEPFIRPAFLATAPAAITTVETELARAVDRIATKYLRRTI